MMIECKCCGKPFEPLSVVQEYCSKECRMIVNRERAKVNQKKYREGYVKPIKKCAYCGSDFVYNIHNKQYCSKECAYAFKLKSEKEERKAHKTKPKKGKTVRDIAREAREHGMTYGKYVAMLEGGMK